MRLVLIDLPSEKRFHFYPIALSRPIWELRCGMTSLGEKLVAKTGAADVACFVPSYMAEAYREQTSWPVNDPQRLVGDDLLLVHGRVKAGQLSVDLTGPSQAAYDDDGELLWARVAQSDVDRDGIGDLCDDTPGDGGTSVGGCASCASGETRDADAGLLLALLSLLLLVRRRRVVSS